MFRDKSTVKSLSFKANANDTNYISKAEAIANSEAWEFELDADDDESDPPEAPAGTFDNKGASSSSTPMAEPPATEKSSKKRKAV